jgi:hypothetical protein
MTVRPTPELALLAEGGDRLGLAAERAQDVERGHVARALPDRVDRRSTVERGHARVLDEAVAAQALERLSRVHRGALADPVLHHRRRQSPEGPGGVTLVIGAGDPQCRDGRRL